MKQTVTTTISLTVEDLTAIIRKHFKSPAEAKVYFKVSNTSEDHYGSSPSYNLVGADVTLQLDVEALLGIDTDK